MVDLTDGGLASVAKPTHHRLSPMKRNICLPLHRPSSAAHRQRPLVVSHAWEGKLHNVLVFWQRLLSVRFSLQRNERRRGMKVVKRRRCTTSNMCVCPCECGQQFRILDRRQTTLLVCVYSLPETEGDNDDRDVPIRVSKTSVLNWCFSASDECHSSRYFAPRSKRRNVDIITLWSIIH